MIELEEFRPQVIPEQRPYPLVCFNAFTYVQKGCVVVLNPKRGIETWPIVEGLESAFANSQILISGNKSPEELFHKLDIHEGEEITWEQFVKNVGNLLFGKRFRLTSFWSGLEHNNVTVQDIPKHVYLFISLNCIGNQNEDDIFFYIDSYQIALTENNLYFKSKEYEMMKSELSDYKSILPSAQFHVLYDYKKADEKAALERIRTDIENRLCRSYDNMDDYEGVGKTIYDLIHVAETLHENFTNEKELKEASKSHILDAICQKGPFDPKQMDWIWRMLVENKLVIPRENADNT